MYLPLYCNRFYLIYPTSLQNHHNRIDILEVKLANLELIVNKVKLEINEEIEKAMTVLQEEIKEPIFAEQFLENDISTFKNNSFIEVMKFSFSSSFGF